ncbi:MAG: bifunctional diaminohydroxyphosphoribosylaminopyrimidine deaminase/5-amino-6-(5-phosphoribosylamino)uracil reductase RibD, partial [Elusimicrobia bacterium]|nr:bifunctional diaminohydroxyphosphoribosylaminopyrimidine deaminase/5-amino-6-(5-phosphoribosylamino)uracil reductase RibD [Elusimicrobiota bacterium]
RIVGEGWHARYGGPHAEPTALLAAGPKARGATAYVTLEPCCHAGKKTPPCVPALLRAGVRRVVVGTVDPHPRVRGRGLRKLRAAGVAVTTGVLEAECARLNRPFFIRLRKARPYVILKAAASLDGRIRTSAGQSKWITSAAARRDGHRLRAEVDAILVGIGTVLADDPALTAHGAGRDPLRVVLDSRLRIPPAARVLEDAGAVVFTGLKDARGPGPRRSLALVRRVRRRGGGLDLREVLAALGEMGVGSVLVEGGGAVHTAFLEAGLVDELRLYLAARLLGGRSAPSFLEGRGFRLETAPALRDVEVSRVGPDLKVSGYLA